jgi:hypothetical protein
MNSKLITILFSGVFAVSFAQKTPLELKSSYYFFDPIMKKQIGPNYDLVTSNSNFDNYIVCSGCKKDESSYYGEFKGGKWGLIDKYGAEILPMVYDQINYETNYISVTQNELKGLADKRGQLIIEPKYHYLNYYELPNYWYGQNASDLYGMVSGKGSIIMPFEFTSFSITNNFIIAGNEQGKWLYNMKGEKVLPTVFDDIDLLKVDDQVTFLVKSGAFNQLLDATGKVIIENQKGMEKVYDDQYNICAFTVSKGGKIGMISLKGEEILPIIYDDLKRITVNKSIYFIAQKDKKYGVLDQNGKNAISFQYDFIEEKPFGNHFIVSNDGKWEEDYYADEKIFVPSSYKIINVKGKSAYSKEISKYKFIENWSSSKTKMIFKSLNSWGVIDEELQTIVPNIYSSMEETYSDGYIVSKGASASADYYGEETMEGGSWYLLNDEFQEITTSSYDLIKMENSSYNIGYIVEKSGLIGMIDLLGQELFPCIYNEMDCNDGGCIVSKMDSKTESLKYGFMDLNSGKELIPCQYDLLDKLSYNSKNYLAKKNKLFGLINNSGEVLVDFKYDFLGDSGNDKYLLINQFGKVRNTYVSGGKFGLVDFNGTSIIPCEYKSIDARISDSLIICETFENTSKMFDLNKAKFIEIAEVQEIVEIDEDKGVIVVGKNIVKDEDGYTVSGTYGVISSKYKWLIPMEYNAISKMKEYLIAVDSLNNASDLFDMNGTKFLDNYSFLKTYNDSLIIASKDGKRYNLFNVKTQKLQLKEDYLSLTNTTEGYWSRGEFLIAQNDKNVKGIINYNGKTIIPFEYCEVEYCYIYSSPQYIVSSCPNINKGIPGKFGVVSSTGKIVIPIAYDSIRFDQSTVTYECLMDKKEIYFDENGEEIKK